MSKYNLNEYSFDALCLGNAGPEIETLVYLVGLVDSDKHVAADPREARYSILYQLFETEGEGCVEGPDDLLGWQDEVLPKKYFPQTPVMFVRRWSPILEMLKRGFEPETLKWLGNAPHAVATGIWKSGTVAGVQAIKECKSDEDLFWAIMAEAFKRARERSCLVNIISQVGWSYEHNRGGLAIWNEKQVARADRILWKRTWNGADG